MPQASGDVCRNPFRSIVVRAVETVYACEEALRILETWHGAPAASVVVEPRAGVGYGVTEAPRGVLYHRYELAGDGTIWTRDRAADLPEPAEHRGRPRRVRQAPRPADDELTRRCEQAIRNYDPCISCATHFLDLDVVHG